MQRVIPSAKLVTINLLIALRVPLQTTSTISHVFRIVQRRLFLVTVTTLIKCVINVELTV